MGIGSCREDIRVLIKKARICREWYSRAHHVQMIAFHAEGLFEEQICVLLTCGIAVVGKDCGGF
jgi:hypothetical protein